MAKAKIHEPETGPGTRELERGMHPGRAADVARIALIAVAMLLVFNAGGLAKWTETLPSNAATARLAEMAAAWSGLMHDLGPAQLFDWLRERVRGE